MDKKMKKKIGFKPQISRDPKDINDPKNAPYLDEGKDGEKFIDWANPGHKLERWGERINILLNGSEEEKFEYYKNLYYARMIRKNRIGPDYENQRGKTEEDEEKGAELMPAARLPLPANEVLDIMRDLKGRIKRLEAQKYLLAQHAGQGGCPESAAQKECSLKKFEPRLRDGPSCASCWMKYADEKIRVIPPDLP